MFVQQGARQFEIWTGKPAPEAEMLRVVELELRRRGSAMPEKIEKARRKEILHGKPQTID